MNHAQHEATSTSRLAFQATIHCLTGCGIGEVLGLGGATLLRLGNAASIILGIVLAYVFGYGLTFVPLVRAGMSLLRATGITFAAETLSITTMEIVDNLVVALSLAVAFVAAYPVNRWLIARGLGHAVVHGAHS
jgi:hypothetical protein